MASGLGLQSQVSEKPDYVDLDSADSDYLQGILASRGGSLPSRSLLPAPLPPLVSDVFAEFDVSPPKEVSTTTAHTRLLRGLLKIPAWGRTSSR